ncbi:sigma-54-dependent transcriptional regulator [Desulfatiferula olefinivorans]
MTRQDPPATVLTVDDDPSILSVMGMRLASGGFHVLSASGAKEAVALAQTHRIDLAVIDYMLGDDDGVALMEKLHQLQKGLPVIILTAYGTISRAVDAMKRGAVNYLAKPFDGEALIDLITQCLKDRAGTQPLTDALDPGDSRGIYRRIIARSTVMEDLIDKVRQVAQTDSNVFIEGESGTGKELIARCLHASSRRKEGPFIAINCAAIPENLMESELLGYEKGAFTSADHRREGLFARAQGGSFFFDEISELPMPMQAKLLRILEEREFYPLGGNRTVKVDVRIIAASNRNLENRISEGLFREDLYYRIRVIPVVLPPLRERTDDILPLARFFLEEFSEKAGKTIRDFAPPAILKLMESPWPGNVRELENTIEYAVAMARGPVITADLIDIPMAGKFAPPSLRRAKETFEKDYLIRLLEMNGGNVSKAADMAGKYRADFYALLRKHGLAPTDFRKR